MARAAQNQAKDTFGQAKGVAGQSQSNANSIYGPLLQQYQAEATNPQGIGTTGLNAENTASQQSTGGSVAGSVGQGNLMAARTRNRGSFQVAANDAARAGMARNSQNAVENIASNERLKQVQKQAGLAGQQSLYGQNLQALLAALGAQNQSTNALTEAGKSGWLQNTMGIINTLANAGSAAARV